MYTPKGNYKKRKEKGGRVLIQKKNVITSQIEAVLNKRTQVMWSGLLWKGDFISFLCSVKKWVKITQINFHESLLRVSQG